MRMFKLITFFLLIILSTESMGQEKWLFDQWISQGYNYELECSISIDTISNDSIFESLKNNYRKVVSEEGVILSYGSIWGGLGTDCGCEAVPHGLWYNRYRDNSLKSKGEYYCNRKIGTWYHYEGGHISKIENYSKAYPNFIREGNHLTYLNGPQYEFSTTGKLIVEGNYRIIEEYSSTDTIYTVNIETYKIEPVVRHGEFWRPKSVKFGIWYFYDENGQIIKEEIERINWTDETIRRVEVQSVKE